LKLSKEYIAGFVDGEGCVSLAWRLKKYVTPSLQITNTNLDVLILIQDIYGGTVSKRIEKRLNRKDSWCLSMFGNLAMNLIRDIEPFLVVKKSQAEIIMGLNRCSIERDVLGRLKRRMTPEMEKDNITRVNRIRELNMRGKNKGTIRGVD